MQLCRLSSLPLIAFGLLFVTGCGDLPKPFQHDPSVPAAGSLVRLSTANRVEVWPPQGGLQNLAESWPGEWAAVLAQALRDAEIPADQAEPPKEEDDVKAARDLNSAAQGYALSGQILDQERDALSLRWVLFSPEGRSLLERTVALATDGSQSVEQLSRLVSDVKLAVEKDMEAPLTRRMAAAPAAPLPQRMQVTNTNDQIKASIPAMDTLPSVALGEIDGFDDARNTMLAGALKRQLTRIGITTDSKSPLTVLAEISQEVLGDTVQLQVIWRLVGEDGQEIGSVKQANPVPAELLEKQFPALAVAIAEGGADGLVALLSQVPADRFR
jgi:hypothetical protein